MVVKCSYFLTAWLLMNTLSPELLKKIYLILVPGTLTFQRRRCDRSYKCSCGDFSFALENLIIPFVLAV